MSGFVFVESEGVFGWMNEMDIQGFDRENTPPIRVSPEWQNWVTNPPSDFVASIAINSEALSTMYEFNVSTGDVIDTEISRIIGRSIYNPETGAWEFFIP